MIPTNDGLTCVFVATSPERLRTLRRPGAESALTALISTAAPTLASRVQSGAPVGRVHGWSGVRGFLRRAGGPGWALVGDSGYFKDPITTHGMTDALRDAELLAGALLAAWSGAVPEAVALRRYQAQRDRLSRGLFTATNRIATYDSDQSEVQGLLREVSASMSDETELLQALPAQRECDLVPSCPTDMLLPRR